MSHLRANWLKYAVTAAVIYVGYQYGPTAQQALVDFLGQIGLAPAVTP